MSRLRPSATSSPMRMPLAPTTIVLGDVEHHPVVAEVGVELVVDGEGVGLPAGLLLEHADLRIPLADGVEVLEVAGAGDHLGQLGE